MVVVVEKMPDWVASSAKKDESAIWPEEIRRRGPRKQPLHHTAVSIGPGLW